MIFNNLHPRLIRSEKNIREIFRNILFLLYIGCIIWYKLSALAYNQEKKIYFLSFAIIFYTISLLLGEN